MAITLLKEADCWVKKTPGRVSSGDTVWVQELTAVTESKPFDVDTEQTSGSRVRAEGRSRWEEWKEQHGNIYTTVCKTGGQWDFAMWFRELKLELCDDLEGWDGVGGGREGQEGGDIYILQLIRVDVWHKSIQYYKAITLHF